MCQKNCCQDYSKQTANNGFVNHKTGNSNLDGSGSIVTLITAAQSGTIVKSVTIKATAATTTGMVRLYIQKSNPTRTILYKELPVPVMPTLSNTPTPNPVLPMFETTLLGDLKLQASDSLVASIQNSDSFNFIVDGLDWEYPSPIPTDCCNFKQISAVTGVELVSTANSNLNGTGTIVPVFTASNSPSSNGTFVKTLTVKALQSTSINGMIRVFVSNDGGTTYFLMKEIRVPQTTQSAFEPSFKNIVDLNFYLQPGYIIGLSTQNNEKFGVTIEGEEWSYPI